MQQLAADNGSELNVYIQYIRKLYSIGKVEQTVGNCMADVVASRWVTFIHAL
jgi:hypothetical protein